MICLLLVQDVVPMATAAPVPIVVSFRVEKTVLPDVALDRSKLRLAEVSLRLLVYLEVIGGRERLFARFIEDYFCFSTARLIPTSAFLVPYGLMNPPRYRRTDADRATAIFQLPLRCQVMSPVDLPSLFELTFKSFGGGIKSAEQGLRAAPRNLRRDPRYGMRRRAIHFDWNWRGWDLRRG